VGVNTGLFNSNYLNLILPILLLTEGQLTTAATIVGSLIVVGGLVWNLSHKLTKMEGELNTIKNQLTLMQYYAERVDKLNEKIQTLTEQQYRNRRS